MDSQSALRRCIELFSHNTRFFIIVEDKYKLLKPILSRFCEIYIPEPVINGLIVNLYKYNIDDTFKIKDIKNTRNEWLKKELLKYNKNVETINNNINELIIFSTKIYEKGYSCIDIINLFDNQKFMESNFTQEKRYELILTFNKIRKEFRNEKILILFILNFIFLSSDVSLENISFM
jgi:DNA polymerase III delta prime subunit